MRIGLRMPELKWNNGLGNGETVLSHYLSCYRSQRPLGGTHVKSLQRCIGIMCPKYILVQHLPSLAEMTDTEVVSDAASLYILYRRRRVYAKWPPRRRFLHYYFRPFLFSNTDSSRDTELAFE